MDLKIGTRFGVIDSVGPMRRTVNAVCHRRATLKDRIEPIRAVGLS